MIESNATAATTEQTKLPAWIHFSSDSGSIVVPVGLAATIILTILGLRRKASKDNTEIAKDRGEKQLIERLISERDMSSKDARDAWKQRNRDAEAIARLESRLLAAEQDIQRALQEIKKRDYEIRSLRKVIKETHPDASKFWGSDFDKL